ncbi:MAG: phosphoribosylglycinamide formyltransferase [Gemmatimonadota bacterium]
MSVRIAVLASGSGTNLQALLDHFRTDDSADITLVISDRADAGALARARAADVDSEHVEVRGRSDDDVARQTLALLEQHGIDMIALAGYLRLVPARVTERFRSRILNIHPALLPAFGGAGMYGRHVHEAVLAARVKVTGATVHFVDERYDEGRVIAQWPVPVLPGDDAATLGARVLRVEHRLFPVVVAAVARSLGHSESAGVGRAASRPSGQADIFRLTASPDGIEAEISGLTGL